MRIIPGQHLGYPKSAITEFFDNFTRMKTGPVIIIEDDSDDKNLLEEILREIGVTNQLVWFENCIDAFGYLQNMNEQPFIIFSDVNLPGQKGIDFKRQVDEHPELRKKSIPFVFYSTSVDQETVDDAYTQMTVQGFFQKKISYKEIKRTIQIIVDYWQECKHPNSL